MWQAGAKNRGSSERVTQHSPHDAGGHGATACNLHFRNMIYLDPRTPVRLVGPLRSMATWRRVTAIERAPAACCSTWFLVFEVSTFRIQGTAQAPGNEGKWSDLQTAILRAPTCRPAMLP